jgi:hypothetical protein
MLDDHREAVGSAIVVAGGFEACGNVATNVSLSQSMRPIAPAFRHLATGGGFGNSLPRFAARRRIPAQAFGLKKNRRSTGPVSKICESEHATAPLRHSEPLRVQSDHSTIAFGSPRMTPSFPSLSAGLGRRDTCHVSNHDAKSRPTVAAEGAGHVLPPGRIAGRSACAPSGRCALRRRRVHCVLLEGPRACRRRSSPGTASRR